MSDKSTAKKNRESGFLFTVEVLVEGKTNGHALEKLTRLLNQDGVADYRVLKGINLGSLIQAMLDRQSAVPAEEPVEPESGKPDAAKAPSELNTAYLPIIEQIEQFKEKRTLVRLSVLKGKGVKLSIPCRILNYEWSNGNITVYHVDEKKVYTFQLNEIDDLTAN